MVNCAGISLPIVIAIKDVLETQNLEMFWKVKILSYLFGVFSLQVMVQRHNRQMSISVYISTLAVSDSVCLLLGK